RGADTPREGRRRDTRRRTRHRDGVPSRWHLRGVGLQLLLSGGLLALVLSGCASIFQDHRSQTDRVLADYERVLEYARLGHNRVREGIALHTLGNAYRARGQSATARAYLTQALGI